MSVTVAGTCNNKDIFVQRWPACLVLVKANIGVIVGSDPFRSRILLKELPSSVIISAIKCFGSGLYETLVLSCLSCLVGWLSENDNADASCCQESSYPSEEEMRVSDGN